MGYVVAMGACCCCKQVISFNPHKVPSLRVRGEREPVCKACIARVNPVRIGNGLEPLVYDEDAYEPIEEGRL